LEKGEREEKDKNCVPSLLYVGLFPFPGGREEGSRAFLEAKVSCPWGKGGGGWGISFPARRKVALVRVGTRSTKRVRFSFWVEGGKGKKGPGLLLIKAFSASTKETCVPFFSSGELGEEKGAGGFDADTRGSLCYSTKRAVLSHVEVGLSSAEERGEGEHDCPMVLPK